MNAKTLSPSLIKGLHGHIAEWVGIVRLLVSLKSNRGFDFSFSDQYVSGETFDARSRAKQRIPNSFRRAARKRDFPARRFVRALGFLLSMPIYSVVLAPAVWAHGGVSVQTDYCRIPVGNQWVHFTAYTPAVTGDTEHCRSIPDLSRTNLVFDYESRTLRKMTVAFEITQEPEGSRVYYQEPKTHKTGSVNAVVDFNRFGAGNYLIHVTLVNKGERVDAHLPFSVGSGGGSFSAYWLTGVLAISGLIVVYFLVPAVRKRLRSFRERGKRPA